MNQPTPIRREERREPSAMARVGSMIFWLMVAVTALLPLNIFLARWALGDL